MKSKTNSKIIKRPRKIISRQSRHTRRPMAKTDDLTMTPTLNRNKSVLTTKNSINKLKQASNKPTKLKKTTTKKITKKTHRKVSETAEASHSKTLDASKRKNLVALNKKQTDFLSDLLNTSTNFAMSQVDTRMPAKFEAFSNFLNSTQTLLIQRAKKIHVPPTKKFMTKIDCISKATYTEISENMDSTIQSLMEAIDKEKMLLAEKKAVL